MLGFDFEELEAHASVVDGFAPERGEDVEAFVFVAFGHEPAWAVRDELVGCTIVNGNAGYLGGPLWHEHDSDAEDDCWSHL